MKIKTRDGILREAEDGQEKTLQLLYGTVWGRMLLKPLTRPALSVLAGKLLSTGCSCVLIKPFIRKNRIDMQIFEPVKYKSYNEFFARKILPGMRPVDTEPAHLISPCDSKLTVLPVTENLRFCLKQTEYTVASLLKEEGLAAEFQDGYVLIFRLTVDDYHRYCYPDSGSKEENVRIPGKLHTVNPIANDYFPVYKENSREYCILNSDHFGKMVMMEVGALLVGKIVNHHQKAQVERGQEKGYFQFGGSTVVLLVKKDTVCMDADLCRNSAEGIETVVKFGEKIGTAFKDVI